MTLPAIAHKAYIVATETYFYVRCTGCRWWVRKTSQEDASGAQRLHNLQGQLVFGRG